jgi:hypothetical protein
LKVISPLIYSTRRPASFCDPSHLAVMRGRVVRAVLTPPRFFAAGEIPGSGSAPRNARSSGGTRANDANRRDAARPNADELAQEAKDDHGYPGDYKARSWCQALALTTYLAEFVLELVNSSMGTTSCESLNNLAVRLRRSLPNARHHSMMTSRTPTRSSNKPMTENHCWLIALPTGPALKRSVEYLRQAAKVLK